jgi:hypothetical protein
MKDEGTVYLLHFERPYNGRSQHYLGFTRNDLEQHLEGHRRGSACATTKVAFKRGIGFTLVGTWSGAPELKREVKARGVVGQCAVCRTRPAATLPRSA